MLLALLPALALAGPFEILREGSFHGEEVRAEAEGSWFALHAVGGRWHLTRVEPALSREFDPVVDADEGGPTGWKIEVPGADPTVLVRGPLREGRVSAAPVPPLAPGGEVRLGGLTLRAEGVLGKEGAPESFRLIASRGGTSQVLVDRAELSEAAPSVVWAGDLDRDGIVDLLLDATDHYNVSEYVLLLSSQAAPGAIYGEAARFRSVGC